MKSPAENTIDAGDLEIGRQHAAVVARRRRRTDATPARGPAHRPARPGRSRCRDARRIRRSRRCRRCWSAADRRPRCRGRSRDRRSAPDRHWGGCRRRRSRDRRRCSRPSVEFDGFDAAVAVIAAVSASSCTAMPLRFDRGFSIAEARASSWRSISRSIRWMTRDLRAGLRQAVGGLQPEQPAADHHRLAMAAARPASIAVDVAEIAEGQHARQIHARHVEPDRRRAGGEHQFGEGQRRAAGES